MRWAALVVLAGCGRLAFDATGDASAPDTPGTDSSSDDGGGDITEGLVFHVPFDGSLQPYTDVARGHGHLCSDCPSVTSMGAGHAAQFTGTQCISYLDSTADLALGRFTIAVRARTEGSTISGNLVGRPLDGASTLDNSYELYRSRDNLLIGHVRDTFVTGPLLDSDYFAAALTFDGATVRLHVDGSEVAASAASGIAYDSADRLRVGCDLNTDIEADHLRGAIDDVRIYDRVLTAAEISQLAE